MQSAVVRSGSGAGDSPEPGVLARLSAGNADALLIYGGLAVPCMLFFAYVGNLPLGLAFTLVAVAVTPCFRSATSDSAHATLACAIAAIVLTTLGGEGRLVAANFDWRIRDAVLHDLVAQPWPFVYRFEGRDWLLRAPLGMYLLPALAGKLVGQYGAMLMLWLQNGVALFIVLRILTAAHSRRASLVVVTVFVAFSGWDVPGAMLTHRGGAIPADVGWWAGLFQYSSTVTLAYWAPNHAIGGWLVAALLLLWEQRRIGIGGLAIGVALAMSWSPFALIGALPFLCQAGLSALRARRVTRREVACAAAVAATLLPLVAYLGADSLVLPHGFRTLTTTFVTIYIVFVGFELLPFVVLNHYVRTEGGFTRGTYRLAVVMLFLLPFYRLGPANEFVMRASVPALAIVAITTGHALARLIAGGRVVPMTLGVGAVAFGALTGLAQTASVLRAANLGISRCDVVQAWDQQAGSWAPKAQYFARLEQVPTLLRAPAPSVHSTGATTRLCSDWRL